MMSLYMLMFVAVNAVVVGVTVFLFYVTLRRKKGASEEQQNETQA